jgi:hypothetical protein
MASHETNKSQEVKEERTNEHRVLRASHETNKSQEVKEERANEQS